LRVFAVKAFDSRYGRAAALNSAVYVATFRALVATNGSTPCCAGAMMTVTFPVPVITVLSRTRTCVSASRLTRYWRVPFVPGQNASGTTFSTSELSTLTDPACVQFVPSSDVSTVTAPAVTVVGTVTRS
jgi:hypothetical protein